jgi:hypothetical protein
VRARRARHSTARANGALTAVRLDQHLYADLARKISPLGRHSVLSFWAQHAADSADRSPAPADCRVGALATASIQLAAAIWSRRPCSRSREPAARHKSAVTASPSAVGMTPPLCLTVRR